MLLRRSAEKNLRDFFSPRVILSKISSAVEAATLEGPDLEARRPYSGRMIIGEGRACLSYHAAIGSGGSAVSYPVVRDEAPDKSILVCFECICSQHFSHSSVEDGLPDDNRSAQQSAGICSVAAGSTPDIFLHLFITLEKLENETRLNKIRKKLGEKLSESQPDSPCDTFTTIVRVG